MVFGFPFSRMGFLNYNDQINDTCCSPILQPTP
jgi:hypothetical protein